MTCPICQQNNNPTKPCSCQACNESDALYRAPSTTDNPNISNIQQPIALWNPKTMAYVSLLLSPLFGAFIQRKNWLALGEPKKAREALVWFELSVICVPIFMLMGRVDWMLGLTLLWWLISAGRQQNFVKKQLHNHYQAKSWFTALAWFFGLIFGFLLVVYALLMVVNI